MDPTQLKCIDKTRDFRQHRQLWIHVSGCPRNQVLPKRIVAVSDYLGASIIFSHCLSSSSSGSGLPSKSNTRQPLVASEMTVSLKVPDDLVSSMSENGHILPKHSAIKPAQLACSISGRGDEELSQLADSVPFFILKVRLERNRLRGCSISVSSPLVSVVSGRRCCCCDTDGP